ncbi:MAG: M24 family metallopeptidase [Candidatus Helarchaeota archaeon]
MENRLLKIKRQMENNKIDLVILFNSRNIFYVSDTAQFSIVVIPLDAEPFIFIKRNFNRGKKETWLKDVLRLGTTKGVIQEIRERKLATKNVGLELNFIRASQYIKLQKFLPDSRFINVDPLFLQVRSIKDMQEIEHIRAAAKAVVGAQRVTREFIAPGVTEMEVAAEIAYELKKHGSWIPQTNAYWDSNGFCLASGENLYSPGDFPILSGVGTCKATPRSASNRVLKDGDIFVLDIGSNVEGYHADHARTYFIGNPDDKFQKVYNIIYTAHKNILELISENRTIGEIFQDTKARMGEYQDYFQGFNGYRQGLGHGVGLHLDEPPYIVAGIKDKLQENMVIALEPKLIIPGWGAVDLEDTFLIRKNKEPELLTPSPYLSF